MPILRNLMSPAGLLALALAILLMIAAYIWISQSPKDLFQSIESGMRNTANI